MITKYTNESGATIDVVFFGRPNKLGEPRVSWCSNWGAIDDFSQFRKSPSGGFTDPAEYVLTDVNEPRGFRAWTPKRKGRTV